MIEYFTVRGHDESALKRELFLNHGGKARIINKRMVKPKGLKKLFSSEPLIELDCIVQNKNEDSRSQKQRDESEKQKLLSMTGTDQTQVKILDEITALRDKLEGFQPSAASSLPESIEKIEELLLDNDFSSKFTRKITSRLKSDLSLEQLEDYKTVQQYTAQLIFDSIPVYKDKMKPAPRIFILVGPTGVGKTTSIAKLSALNALGAQGLEKKKVVIITIDCYRIGAKEQMEKYGEIMSIPVLVAENNEVLKEQINRYNDADIIFIDTIGKSPKDYLKLAEMRDILEGCNNRGEVHLAVSASTKGSDIKDIFSQFESFDYQSVIITKLDETSAVGNLISALHEKQKSVSYITHGQKVPSDISKASGMKLMEYVKGLEFSSDNLSRKLS